MPCLVPVIATSIQTGEVFHYRSMTEAAKKGGFERSCVHSCIHGQSPSHAGFTFVTKAVLRPQRAPTVHYRIAALLNEGKTREETAEILGVKVKTIRSRLPIARRMGLLNEGL